MMRFTHFTPVRGSPHWFRIFFSPFFVTCSIVTMSRRAPATRSIAPPIPFTIAPGTIQLAMTPLLETCIAPRIDRSTLQTRIIENESADEKNDAPGYTVSVYFQALMISNSTTSMYGYDPNPVITDSGL